VAQDAPKAASTPGSPTTSFCPSVCPCFATSDQTPANHLPDFNQEFTASVGPNSNTADARKFCQINLKLEYDAGYSFAVYDAEFAGSADIDSGITGDISSTYYFSGQQEQVNISPQKPEMTLLTHLPAVHFGLLHPGTLPRKIHKEGQGGAVLVTVRE